MQNPAAAFLEFDLQLNRLNKSKELRSGLSAVVQIEDTLWVANDETISIERLSLQKKENGDYYYGQHKQFLLSNYLSLPAPPANDNDKIEEADIEGMDYNDGYLWLIGSHSLKRKKVDKEDTDDRNAEKLAKISSDGNRFLLARIPVVKEDGTYTLKEKTEDNGKMRKAALLHGNQTSNELTEALRTDEHLHPFLTIPGKDNGFDIEGLAIAGDKIFVGLRGPVLRGWAIILELDVKEAEHHHELKLKSLKKHFLHLNGLGIRDLVVQKNDLLILAGPTMDLDGPVHVFRWKDGVGSEKRFVYYDEENAGDVEKRMDINFGKGFDHAEGLALFSENGGNKSSLLLVYDAVAKERLLGESTVKVDVIKI